MGLLHCNSPINEFFDHGRERPSQERCQCSLIS